MLLNLDIWYEIVNHLKYPEHASTLHSLAVTSRSLSNIALDTIWRDGEPILYIVLIVNLFAPSPNEPFLLYVDDRWNDDRDAEDTEDDESTSSGGFTGNWVSFTKFLVIS